MTDAELLDLARRHGCDHVSMLNVAALDFNPAVRTMCAADRCRNYGRCWSCPPYCGTLEEAAEKAAKYHRGILFQCTQPMEDDFDVEAMAQGEARLKEAFYKLCQDVRGEYPNCLPMSAGACRICETCTCPDQPCRFPALSFPSMEAYGLIVSKTCTDSGLKYYYGPHTITFTACILVD